MKVYKVYERAGVYRVAAPGWLFWHWVWDYPFEAVCKYETTSRDKAMTRMRQENEKARVADNYRKASWREI